MIVYYSILIYLIYLGAIKKLSDKYKKAEYIIVFLASVILLLFAALRSVHIGADTDQYCSHFLHLQNTKWNELTHYYNKENYYGDIEFGYKIYNKLVSVFRNQQTIIITNSILQIGILSIVIIKQSKDKWLSYFLYFSFCFYQTALNLTPSSFVSYFVFLSFPFIKNRKILAFLVIVAIGMLFHTSAIFFIPLYFLSKIKINKKSLSIVALVFVLIFAFYPLFMKVVSYILPQKYLMYIDGSRGQRQNSIEIVVLLVQIIAMLFCALQIDKKKVIDAITNNSLISWLIIYEILLYLLSLKASMFQRGAFLFSPYVIIIIPNIIDKIEGERRSFFTKLGIVVYGTLLYILRVQINNVGTTIPYEFFFNC